jgi:hypothetical protein
MGYRLADPLSYCVIGETAIFLDLQADRYFCLGETARAAFDAVLKGQTPSTHIAADIARLEAAGVIQWHECETQIAPIAYQPIQADADTADARPSSSEILAAFYHVGKAGLYLRSHSLLDTVIRLQTKKSGVEEKDSTLPKVRAITQAHSHLRRIMPSTDRCLQRSLALADHLVAADLLATLVFGVTLAPFSAHCWVQYGSMVLNDHIDYVAQRTPILVL